MPGMKLMKFFRRSKREKAGEKQTARYGADGASQHAAAYHESKGSYSGGGYNTGAPSYPTVFAPWLELPIPVLQRVLSFVCPHTSDESYETCEQSALPDACMLCDVRDLANAGSVCRMWRKASIPIMYHSIRLDSVHYCEREIYLSDKRKRHSRWDKNGVPEDPATARLHLLCRTLRDDPTRRGVLVQFFKTPYMLRESQTALLARTLSVLPNLRYVDLPEGLFEDDPAYSTLRLEVQARCANLRKMTYKAGSERSLEVLANGTVWQKLEVLELVKISMDPGVLRHVLSIMPKLRALKINDSRIFDDDIFHYNDMMPAIPALEELDLVDTPRVTADGLAAYVERPDVQQSLKVLSVINTSVRPQELHTVLHNALKLQALTIVQEVDTAFPSMNTPMPPLANFALQTLRYEITSAPSASAYASMTQGYYNYLAQSLFAGGFPMLTALYVRDLNFPDLLVGLPPPMPGFAGANSGRPSSSNSMRNFNGGGGLGAGLGSPQGSRFSSNNPFASAASNRPGLGPPVLNLNQTLEVFTKGDDDMDWGIVKMDPIDNPGYAGGPRGHARTGSTASMGGNRPLSSYGLADMGANWREGAGGARRSIMMGNGTGGFLALPASPESIGHGRRGSNTGLRNNNGAGGGDEWPRPSSSAGGKGDRDLWR